MKHFYVNRESRLDRNFLFRGAMASQGVPADNLCRVPAMDLDDYKTAREVCEAAKVDFPEFFGYHLDNMPNRMGYGNYLAGWSILRMWRDIAAGTDYAGAWLDDYALRVPEAKLRRLVDDIEPDILQLVWHYRPDIFVDNCHALPFTFDVPTHFERVSQISSLFRGAPGGSDWAIILSPRGACWLLDFMESVPYFTTEEAIQAFYLQTRRDGIFSVSANNPLTTGLDVLTGNAWVVQLWEYTDWGQSDLQGIHVAPTLEVDDD